MACFLHHTLPSNRLVAPVPNSFLTWSDDDCRRSTTLSASTMPANTSTSSLTSPSQYDGGVAYGFPVAQQTTVQTTVQTTTPSAAIDQQMMLQMNQMNQMDMVMADITNYQNMQQKRGYDGCVDGNDNMMYEQGYGYGKRRCAR
jgi:hypothetical protein